MILNDGKMVRTGDGILIWDGLRNPNKRDSGSIDYNVKIAFPPSEPTLVELEQLVQNELNQGIFRGTMPAGGIHPIGDIDAGKIPELPGYKTIKFGTSQGVPHLFDKDGNQTDIMACGQWLYAGVTVQVLASCWSYNDKSKGIGFNLGGLMFMDVTSTKLAVSSGMSADDARSAFGPGANNTPPAGMAGGPGAPSAPGAGPPAPGFTSPKSPQERMLVDDFTYEQYVTAGHNEQSLIAEGKMSPP